MERCYVFFLFFSLFKHIPGLNESNFPVKYIFINFIDQLLKGDMSMKFLQSIILFSFKPGKSLLCPDLSRWVAMKSLYKYKELSFKFHVINNQFTGETVIKKYFTPPSPSYKNILATWWSSQWQLVHTCICWGGQQTLILKRNSDKWLEGDNIYTLS